MTSKQLVLLSLVVLGMGLSVDTSRATSCAGAHAHITNGIAHRGQRVTVVGTDFYTGGCLGDESDGGGCFRDDDPTPPAKPVQDIEVLLKEKATGDLTIVKVVDANARWDFRTRFVVPHLKDGLYAVIVEGGSWHVNAGRLLIQDREGR